jgi:acetyltransferase-like isoleucine patch superfamily enzyme
MVDPAELIRSHPSLQSNPKLGKEGFSMPDLGGCEVIRLDTAGMSQLAALGIEVTGDFGSDNMFYVGPQSQKLSIKVSLHRRANNLFFIARNARLRGSLVIEQNNNIFVAGTAFMDVGVTAVFRYGSGGLFLGEGGSSPMTSYWIEGPDTSIQVGDDFLFSWGIWIRTADSHAMFDMADGRILNPPRSIVVGPHVWLGQDVIVMPGVKIGGGAIIGARSVVTKTVPVTSVAVGAPARVVKRGISWTRSAKPSEEAISIIQNKFIQDID